MFSKIFKQISQHKLAAGVILLIIIGGGYFSYQNLAGDKNVVQYVTAAAEKGTLVISVSGSGNVISDDTAEIDPGISGEISEIKVALGDKVKKGQLLLVIENDDLEAKRAQAWIAYNQAKEALEKAKLDKLQTDQSLEDLLEQKEGDPDSVSDLDIKIAEQKVKSAKLAIESAENKVWSSWLDYNQAKEEANKREVTAPINGTVTALNIKVGDSVGSVSGATGDNKMTNSSSSSLITITNLEKFKANIALNEIDVTKVKIGQSATLTFDAIEDFTLTGKVSEIDVSGTVTQGVVSFNVKIAFDAKDGRIKPGMTVSAAIVTQRKDNVLLVPNAAVKTEGGQTFVEVLQNETPQSVSVEVGLSNEVSTEIISGLQERDNVVTARLGGESTTSDTTGQPFRIPGMTPSGGFKR